MRNWAQYRITDGTHAGSVSFVGGIDGFWWKAYSEAIPATEGFWRESPFADGKVMVDSKETDAIDRHTLGLTGGEQNEPEDAIRRLEQLLIKAAQYGTTDWQDEPVWMERRVNCASCQWQYAIVKGGALPNLQEMIDQVQATMPPSGQVTQTVLIEREPWSDYRPGGCVADDTETQAGCFPYYIEFDGATTVVNCGSGGTIDNLPGLAAHTDQITVDGWIRADSYGGGLGRIAVKIDPTSAWGWLFYIDGAEGLFGFIANAGQPAFSSSGLDEFTADGLWHHVLMTYDEAGAGTPAARTIYLAIDGVWVASYSQFQVSIGAYRGDAAQNLYLGADTIGGGGSWFDGGIGWMRVSDNIRYDPAAGNFTPEPQCELPTIDAGVACQVIYEGTGVTTYDRSGNANDGTISNGTWDCVCTTTDTDAVDCNCVQASGVQEDWEYGIWDVLTVQPLNSVEAFLELGSGWYLAGDVAGGIWRTNTGGAVWLAAAAPPAGSVRSLYLHTDGYAYSLDNLAVRRSNDDGDNWAVRSALVNANSQGQKITGLNGNLYLSGTGAAGNGVYRSTDAGLTWAQVLDGTVDTLECNGEALVVAMTAPNTKCRFYRSTDGLVWNIVYDKAYPLTTTAMWGSAHRGATFFISHSYSVGGGVEASDIVISYDNGQTWGIITTLTDAVNGLRIDGLYADATSLLGCSEYTVGGANGNVYEFLAGGTAYRSVATAGAGNRFFSVSKYSTTGLAYAGAQGEIWDSSPIVDMGRQATCTDEVFVANKQNKAQLTNVWTYDAAPVAWQAQFPMPAGGQFNIFPAIPAVGDILYIGIESTAVIDTGPFNNIVLDIGEPLNATSWTVVWKYSDGGAGWPTLNVNDETNAFMVSGVRCVTWVPPDADSVGGLWTPEVVNGVTALWILAEITAIAGAVSAPTQQMRDIYTITWPRVSIDDAQADSDLPLLLQTSVHNRSDENAYEATVDELDLLDNRIVASVRSVDRGTQFVQFINLAEDGVVATTYAQNSINITVTDGTGTTTAAEIRAPSGIACLHTTQGNGIASYDDAATITFEPTVARDFYGRYHAYVRAQLYEPAAAPAGDDEDVRVRLQVRTGTGGITATTQYAEFTGWDEWDGVAAVEKTHNDFQLLDMGEINFPVSGLFKSTELPDEAAIVVQVASKAATALRVQLYDLVLVPVDEWAGDFQDTAFENDSGVSNDLALDVDSVTYPKQPIRALVRSADATGFVHSKYRTINPGPAILQANADQRLYFLTARGVAMGEEDTGGVATSLDDANQDFIKAGVQPGMIAYNDTTGNSAVITAVAQRDLTTATIVGGWNLNDDYHIICPKWRSEPCNAHSIQVWGKTRYKSVRGS